TRGATQARGETARTGGEIAVSQMAGFVLAIGEKPKGDRIGLFGSPSVGDLKQIAGRGRSAANGHLRHSHSFTDARRRLDHHIVRPLRRVGFPIERAAIAAVSTRTRQTSAGRPARVSRGSIAVQTALAGSPRESRLSELAGGSATAVRGDRNGCEAGAI